MIAPSHVAVSSRLGTSGTWPDCRHSITRNDGDEVGLVQSQAKGRDSWTPRTQSSEACEPPRTCIIQALPVIYQIVKGHPPRLICSPETSLLGALHMSNRDAEVGCPHARPGTDTWRSQDEPTTMHIAERGNGEATLILIKFTGHACHASSTLQEQEPRIHQRRQNHMRARYALQSHDSAVERPTEATECRPARD